MHCLARGCGRISTTMLWYAKGNVETSSHVDICREGVAAKGNPLGDNYVTEILPNTNLRRNLARVHD